MKGFQDAFNGRGPTDEEVATLADVVEIALAWQQGTLPLASVRTLCTEPERFTAMRFCEPHSAQAAVLTALLDALIASEGSVHAGGEALTHDLVMTEHGLMTMEGIIAADGRFLYDRNGRRVVQFPYDVVNGLRAYRDIPDYVVQGHDVALAQRAGTEGSS